MENTIDFNIYRSFLLSKKQNNIPSDLLPPYTKDEIDTMCNIKNINLPDILYEYLINVSREIFFHEQSYIFDFNDVPDYNTIISNSFEDVSNINELKKSPLMVIISSTSDKIFCIYFSKYYYGSIWVVTHNDMKLLTDINTFFIDNIVNCKQNVYLLNGDNSINWNNFRLFITEKKLNILQENGTKTMNSLESPYNESVVNEIIKIKDININIYLFNYLTKVSKEILLSNYPIVFDINNIPNKNEIHNMDFEINEPVRFIWGDDFYYINDNGIKEGNGHINEDDFDKCILNIGKNDYNLYDCIYFGKGELHGSIWKYDGDYYSYIAKDFEDYLYKIIHHKIL